METLADKRSVLSACRTWHKEAAEQTTDERDARRYLGEAAKLNKRILIIDEKLGLMPKNWNPS